MVTGSRITKLAFWLAVACGLALFISWFSTELTPFVLGIAIAYLLNPLACRLEGLGMGRTLATSIIFGGFFLVLLLLILLLMPTVIYQLLALSSNAEHWWQAILKLVHRLADSSMAKMLNIDAEQVVAYVKQYLVETTGLMSDFSQSLATRLNSIVTTISIVFLTPVIAFYMLLDWEKMLRTVDGWLPRAQAPTVRGLFREIDLSMAGFIRGQFTVCLLLSFIYVVGLLIVGLDYAILIGLGSGMLSFIPYLGSISGLLVSLCVALWQFWPEYFPIALTVAVYLMGQAIEGNVLQPKLVGQSVGVHPVWLLFALFAFGSLFGFIGLLIAVPLASTLGVFTRFGLGQYKKSRFYDDIAP